MLVSCVNAINPIKEFYCLEAIKVLIKPEQFKHSHQYFLRNFNDYYERFTDNLQQAIWDYTVLVSGGELRHARRKAEKFNPSLPCDSNDCRSSSFVKLKQFNPKDIIKSAYYGFKEVHWTSSGYGGDKWGEIALAAIKKDEWKNKVLFIDHCVDLSHNSSPYLDKSESGIFRLDNPSEYIRFLNFKRECKSPIDILKQYWVSGSIQKLITIGKNIGIFRENISLLGTEWELDHDIKTILNYKPIEWGGQRLPMKFVTHSDYSEECEEDCDDCCQMKCKNNPNYIPEGRYEKINLSYNTGKGERDNEQKKAQESKNHKSINSWVFTA
jgi:hypothetical protein